MRIIVWILFCIAATAYAQSPSVGTQDAAIVMVTPEYVQVNGGCNPSQKIKLTSGAIFKLDDVCVPSGWGHKEQETSACLGATISILAVTLHNQIEPVLVESLVVSERNFHMRLFGRLEDAHGARSELNEISRLEWCIGTTFTSDPQPLPLSTCREPRQFAVEFNYLSPLSNKILTNGFSFYIRVAGTPTREFRFDSFADEVLTSFQRAITMWVASLSDHDALLTPAIRNFIASRTSKSAGGYTLLTPPQVIRLNCPHTATFVIEINFGGDGLFPSFPSPIMLAKGRLEGRTIALNLKDVTCFRTMPEFNAEKRLQFSDGRCTNLLPVLTHEIGHAFGIEHIEEISGSALMNPRLADTTLEPTQLDVRALVSVLEKSITGAKPGILEFRASEGVLAPKTRMPKTSH